MTKLTKKNILFGLSSAVLLSVSLTLAYFTSSDLVTNRMASQSFGITLNEKHWQPEKSKNTTPDRELEKDPSVSNTEQTDAYVFLKVTMPYMPTMIPEYNSGEDQGKDRTRQYDVPLFKFMVDEDYDESFTKTQKVYSDYWMLLDGYPIYDDETFTMTYVYAYAEGSQLRVLKPGQETPKPLFDKVKIVNFEESAYLEEKTYNIAVDAYAIQTNYILDGTQADYTPQKVWEKLQEE